MPIGLGTAVLGAGALSAGAGIFGSLTAAQTQQNAAALASQTQLGMFNQGAQAVGTATGNLARAVQSGQQSLAPYLGLGQQFSNLLSGSIGNLTQPFQPTMAQLSQTPGYQFTLGQGEQAVTNANSAMGLANSGVQGKGLANYAEGLASTTYQQQFQNYLQQNQQIYSQLYGGTQLGAQAAQQYGALGLTGAQAGLGGAESLLGGAVNTGGQLGSNIIGAGNASAAGTLGVANSVGNLGTNALNSYAQLSLLQRLGAPNNAAGGNNADFGAPGVGSGGYNFLDAQAG